MSSGLQLSFTVLRNVKELYFRSPHRTLYAFFDLHLFACVRFAAIIVALTINDRPWLLASDRPSKVSNGAGFHEKKNLPQIFSRGRSRRCRWRSTCLRFSSEDEDHAGTSLPAT